MKDVFQPIHAYFFSVSASAFLYAGIIYGWPAPALIALTLSSLFFLGIGSGMTVFDIVQLAKSRREAKGGDSIDG